MTQGKPETPPQGGDRAASTLRTHAHDQFMRYLFSGHLKPGQMVSQRELCEALDVGMGPLREALKRLEAEDFVALIPQRGVRILDIDEKVVKDAFQLRMMIEPEAVHLFVEEGSRDSLEDLLVRTSAASKIEQRGPLDVQGIDALVTLDHEMHYLFLSALRNSFADGLFQRMFSRLRLQRLVYRLRTYRDPVALLEHIEILELAMDGDADGAADAMRRHLDRSWRRAVGLE